MSFHVGCDIILDTSYIIMTKLTKKERHQVKSRWYYLFWGAATVSVFAGQMYVGSGYRQMSRAFNRLLDTTIEVLQPTPRIRGYYAPIVPPPPENYYEDDMVLRQPAELWGTGPSEY